METALSPFSFFPFYYRFMEAFFPFSAPSNIIRATKRILRENLITWKSFTPRCHSYFLSWYPIVSLWLDFNAYLYECCDQQVRNAEYMVRYCNFIWWWMAFGVRRSMSTCSTWSEYIAEKKLFSFVLFLFLSMYLFIFFICLYIS